MSVARVALYFVSLVFSALVLYGLLTGDEFSTGLRLALYTMLALGLVVPRYGLFVFAALSPIVGGITLLLGHHTDDVQLLEGSALALVAGWAIRGLVLERCRAKVWSPVALCLVAWLAYLAGLAIWHGWDHIFALKYFLKDFVVGLRVGDAARTALTMTAGPWLALVAIETLATGSDRERTAWAFVLGVSGAAVLNLNRLIEAAVRNEQPWNRLVELLQTQRVNTLFTDLNAAGSWFVMAAILAAGLWIVRIRRISSALAAIAAMGGTLLSGSRAALMACGAVGMAWLIGRLPTRHRIIAAVVGLILLFGLLQLSTARRQLSDSDEQLSVQFRMMMLSTGWRMFQDHPLLGVGPGRFFPLSADYMDPEIRARMYPYENAHNNFLQILAETGIVGAFVFVSLLVALAWSAWHARGSDLLIGPLCAGLGAFLLTCLLGHPLLVPHVASGFWLLVGVLGAVLSTGPGTTRTSATQSTLHAG